jgi:predicted dehydrogenase
LDGGIHFVAGLRKVLPSRISRVAAFSRLNRQYLGPVDTLHATLRLEDGTTGTFGISFASGETKVEVEIMGEQGSVVAELGFGAESIVTVRKGGTKDVSRFKDANGKAIMAEFVAFGEAVKTGVWGDGRGDPEEAAIDVTIMESMLQSGENNGQSIDIKY